MVYKPYSIVTIPYPLTDITKTKKRPALIISTEAFQQDNGHALLMMITTTSQSPWKGDYLIKSWREAGLPVPSYVRQKIFTLDLRMIDKKVGSLSFMDARGVSTLLHQHIHTF